MKIENQEHLDFSDVLIKPKRSTLTSRSEVNLERTFTCKHSNQSWTGVPIIAANIDTTGTFELARALSAHNMLTAVHKHYSVKDWKSFILNSDLSLIDNVFVTTGTSDSDLKKLDEILALSPSLNKICIDVANGYTQMFLDKVKFLRSTYPDKIILAGNVVSYEMTEELILNGASIVKVGIGPGCFEGSQLVKTKEGLKPISSIVVGDKVLTHENRFKKVLDTIEYNEPNSLLSVNGIKSTIKHKYYVVLKKDCAEINEDNISEYAFWIEAFKLDKNNHMLIEFNDNLSLIEITDIHEISYTGPVYDLTVEDDHSFNIEGVVVHNSFCTTRKMTGVGVPQLSAIIECADAAHGLDGLICGDGGCTNPGDIAKALAAGSDFVMIGGMLTGHDENPGDIEEKIIDGTISKFKVSYGMSSTVAINKYAGGVQKYRASEGKVVKVPYRGPIDNTLIDILGGIRSTCTYVGASKLKHLSKRTTFIRVNNQLNEVFGKS